MKGSARTVLAFLAMLVMMLAAFAIGAYRGYFNDRLQVELALSSLSDVLTTRIEMGHNLLTVAGRHLDEEEAMLQSVKKDIADLSSSVTLDAKASANERLTRDSKALLILLENTDSVKADQRDLRYVTGLLPRGFEQSAQWADAAQYNAAANEFNTRLEGTINGRVAQLLGIDTAELFGNGGAGL